MFDLSAITITLPQILWMVFGLYLLFVFGIILLDNRSPQSTFAWLFLMLAFPVLGLLVYIFFGRDHKAFSNENKLAQIGGLTLPDGSEIKRLRDNQARYAEKVRIEKPESYRQSLLRLVRRNSPSLLTVYNQVEILQDATEKYPRLLADIRAAKSSIHLLYYIWTQDDFTNELKDALIERAKAGVTVHALADESNFLVSKEYLEELRSAGVKIFAFNAFKSLSRLHTANYRSHRKIAIIDGRIGYVGGMNLDKEQLPGMNKLGFWRDTHLRIVGEAALVLQAIFAVGWFNTTQEKLLEPVYFPEVDPESLPVTPVQITNGGPDSQWKAMQQLYFFMIMNARHKVQIQSPFFIPDESLLEAIKSAALSGVEVEIMCTMKGAVFEMPYRAAYTYFADVVRAGAKVYLYKKGYFHCKTINVDSQVCAIGTANFDIRSFYLNYETMAVVYDEAVACELATDFQNDIKDCDLFSLEDYSSGPVWRRLLDSVWRLASPVL
jgi:cardiolipin synthase A/B